MWAHAMLLLPLALGADAHASVSVATDGLGLLLDAPALSGWLGADWLREGCAHTAGGSEQPAAQCRAHALPHAPIVDASVEPPSPAEEGSLLRVRFADGLSLALRIDELGARYRAAEGEADGAARASAALGQLDEPVPPPLTLWTSNLSAPPEVEYAELLDPRLGAAPLWPRRRHALGRLFGSGLVLLRRTPHGEGECARVSRALSSVHPAERDAQLDARAAADADGSAADHHRPARAHPTEPRPAAHAAAAAQPGEAPPAQASAPRAPDFALVHAGEAAPGPVRLVDALALLEALGAEAPHLFDALVDGGARGAPSAPGLEGGSEEQRVPAPRVELRPADGMPAGAARGAARCRAARCVLRLHFPHACADDADRADGGGAAPGPAAARGEVAGGAALEAARRRFDELAREASMGISVQLAPGDVLAYDPARVLLMRARADGGWRVEPAGGAHGGACALERGAAARLHARLRRLARAPGGPDGTVAPQTAWRALGAATAADFAAMGSAYGAAVDAVLGRTLLGLLTAQRGVYLGAPVDLLEHALQTATRALRGGESEEVVVASLLHDATENLASKNHGGAVSALLEPYLSPSAAWLLAQHEVFQGYYYYHHVGGDREARQALRARAPNASWWDATARWCEAYDQAAFDPDYPSLPLHAFEPALARVLARTPYWWEPRHPKAAAVTGAAAARADSEG